MEDAMQRGSGPGPECRDYCGASSTQAERQVGVCSDRCGLSAAAPDRDGDCGGWREHAIEHSLQASPTGIGSAGASAAYYRQSLLCGPAVPGSGTIESLDSCTETEPVRAEDTATDVRTYTLTVVQHPDRGAEFCDVSALSRLPLAPPLIARLSVRGRAGDEIIDEEDLQSLVAHLSLFSSDGLRPLYSRDDSVEGQGVYKRLMYGGLVSAPHVLRGLGTSRPGVYFLFPDVSIRHTGSYRIKVSLLRLPSLYEAAFLVSRSIVKNGCLGEAWSLSFDVHPLAGYVGHPTTPMTEYFIQQGANMVRSSRVGELERREGSLWWPKKS